MTGVTIGTVFLPVYRQATTFVDAQGISWLCLELSGWDDGWEGAGQVTQRPSAPGGWVAPQVATPRVLSVKGRMIATSGLWDDVTRAWDGLQAAVGFEDLAPIVVSTGEGSLGDQTALVRQHQKPVLTRLGNRGDFSLSLIAPDPRRYATATQSLTLGLPANTGGLTPPLTPPLTPVGTSAVSQGVAVNAGNTDAPLTITLPGPCPAGAVIANTTTGKAIRVMDAVSAAETLVLDTAAGTATVNGQARKIVGTWPSLARGSNTLSFYAVGGYDPAASAVITWRSAWR